MDYFTPGLRELARQLQRLALQLRLRLRQRELDRAETDLGLLGWQQADFDPDTQRQVDEIQQVELEQTRLTNESARVGNELRQMQTSFDGARKDFEDARRELEAERRKLREPHVGLQRQLAEKRKIEPNFERRIPELDRELREVQKRYAELLVAEGQTPKMRNELVHLRERMVAIPNEKADLRTQHLRTVSEIRALEETLAREAEAVREIDERLGTLQKTWGDRDRAFVLQLKTLSREKEAIEGQINALETAKANPYQRIGQVLADHDLAPLNQPQALEKVKKLRLGVGELHQMIVESQAISAQEDRHLVHTSFVIWAGMAVVLLLAMAAILR